MNLIKHYIIVSSFLLFALVSNSSVILAQSPINTLTVCVTPADGCNYTVNDPSDSALAIQNAVNAAQNNDVVVIREGTYTRKSENASILNIASKQLTIKGEGNVILQGRRNQTGVKIYNNAQVSLENISIAGFVSNYGIALIGEKSTFKSIKVYENYNGIIITTPRDITTPQPAQLSMTDSQIFNNLNVGLLQIGSEKSSNIQNVSISGNHTGIYSTGNLVINNSIIFNNTNDGVVLTGSGQSNLRNISVYKNSNGISVLRNNNATITHSVVGINNKHGLDCYENSKCSIDHSIAYGNGSGGIVGATQDRFATVEYNISKNNGTNWNDAFSDWPPDTNKDLEPKFKNIEEYNFLNASDSPAIDAGNPQYFDWDGSVIDIGISGSKDSFIYYIQSILGKDYRSLYERVCKSNSGQIDFSTCQKTNEKGNEYWGKRTLPVIEGNHSYANYTNFILKLESGYRYFEVMVSRDRTLTFNRSCSIGSMGVNFENCSEWSSAQNNISKKIGGVLALETILPTQIDDVNKIIQISMVRNRERSYIRECPISTSGIVWNDCEDWEYQRLNRFNLPEAATDFPRLQSQSLNYYNSGTNTLRTAQYLISGDKQNIYSRTCPLPPVGVYQFSDSNCQADAGGNSTWGKQTVASLSLPNGEAYSQSIKSYIIYAEDFSYNPTDDISNCPSHQNGDANCDNVIDNVDFEIWRNERFGETQIFQSDFNRDRVVDNVDFEIWRKGGIRE